MDKNLINEWIFPDVNVALEEEVNNALLGTDIPKSIPKEEDPDHLAVLALRAELEEMKLEYANRIDLLNTIFKKLEHPLSILDKEMVDLMQDIIKKTVKKIIHKEMKSDSKILPKIIDELKILMNEKNSTVTVSLSEVDYKRLKTNENNPSMAITVNPALNQGDVIIKSNLHEIRSIIDERIDKLFGTKND